MVTILLVVSLLIFSFSLWFLINRDFGWLGIIALVTLLISAIACLVLIPIQLAFAVNWLLNRFLGVTISENILIIVFAVLIIISLMIFLRLSSREENSNSQSWKRMYRESMTEMNMHQTTGVDIQQIETSQNIEISQNIVTSQEAYAVAEIKDLPGNSQLLLRYPFYLYAGILQNKPTSPEVEAVKIELPLADKTLIDVVVHAENMIIEPQIQQFIFQPGVETKLLMFVLIPSEAGHKEIQVEFYYQRHWLTRIAFEVEIVTEAKLVPAE